MHLQQSARLQALGEVVAGVIHEVRNVLQVTLGHAWLAQQKVQDLPNVGRHLDQVALSCESGLRIGKNALAVARKPSSEPTWISVTEVVQRVVEHDGRPKQATETRPQRVTIMYRRGDPPPWLPKEALPRGGQPAVTAEVTPPTEPAWEPDLVPMEGPPEGPFAR
jgi:hypothetical protein